MTTKGNSKKETLNNIRKLKESNEECRKEIKKLKAVCLALSEVKKNEEVIT